MRLDQFTDRWDLLDDLFQEAMQLAPEERTRFCDEACRDDPSLREFLLDLVRAADGSDERVRDAIGQLAEGASESVIPSGRRLGAYQIDSLLDRGGMGEVYMASRADGQFEKTVVVKVVRQRPDSDVLFQLSKAERQALARLDHRFIPVLLDAGQLDDGRPYLITEFVDGTPIDVFCAGPGRTRLDAVKLMCMVCEAVRHAHVNLILHLDIKPNNILITQDGTPRLLDFGVARLIGETPQDGITALTPEYASPEQLQGRTPSIGCDVYALGILLYRLLCGHLPLAPPGTAPRAASLARCDEVAQHLQSAEVAQTVGTELRAVIAKATAVSPDARYLSVGELQSDLLRYIRKRPVSPLAGSRLYRLRKFLRRNPLATALAVSVLVLAFVLTSRETERRREAQIAQVESRRDAETAREVADFLVGLFEVSDPAQGRGQDISARDLLRRGTQRIDSAIHSDPLVKARLLRTLGLVHSRLGLYDESRKLYTSALGLVEQLDPADPQALSAVTAELADLLLIVDEYDEAERYLTESLRLRRQSLPANDLAIAQSLKQFGVLHRHQGRYEAAADVLNAALAMYGQDTTAAVAHANALIELASVRYEQRRHEDALAHAQRAVDMLRPVVGVEHPVTANALRVVGATHRELGDHQLAGPIFREVEAVFLRLYGPEHSFVANLYNEMASLHHDNGAYDTAIDYYDRAIAIDSKAFDGTNPGLARATNNKAWAYADMEAFAQAEGLFRDSLAMRLELYGDAHPYVARAKHNLGWLCIMRGQFDEALSLIQQDLDYKRATLAPDEQRMERSWYRFGQVHHRRGDFEQAADYYAKARARLESADRLERPFGALLLYDVGLLELDRGRLDRAQAPLERALAIQQARLSPAHPHAARTAALLAEVRLQAGRTADTAPLVAAIASMRRAFVSGAPSLERAERALVAYRSSRITND